MARCRCTDACACVLHAGNNTTVTGTGQSNNPWVVNAVPSSQGTIQFVDSMSNDWEVTGHGMASDPYQVAVHVKLDGILTFQDTFDIAWDVEGAGDHTDPFILRTYLLSIDTQEAAPLGYVLGLRADGTYGPQPPSTAPVGAINTGAGLDGDGSAGNPLRVSLPTYADLEALP